MSSSGFNASFHHRTILKQVSFPSINLDMEDRSHWECYLINQLGYKRQNEPSYSSHTRLHFTLVDSQHHDYPHHHHKHKPADQGQKITTERSNQLTTTSQHIHLLQDRISPQCCLTSPITWCQTVPCKLARLRPPCPSLHPPRLSPPSTDRYKGPLEHLQPACTLVEKNSSHLPS